MATWDPALYESFADHRGRPFDDLTRRIRAERPRHVVDLGCGPGTLTAGLLQRWPDATVLGIDSSPEMIETAQERAATHGHQGLSYELSDLREWLSRTPTGAVDVIISNATLQWVPGHLDLVPDLARVLAPGGWLAIQVPGNHHSPVHALLREVAAREPYAEATAGLSRLVVTEPADYLHAGASAGLVVDAWETTYLHVLAGEDPVFRWISGTGARPVLQALEGELKDRFVAEYQQELRLAYPASSVGTVLPFRRVFAVGKRA